LARLLIAGAVIGIAGVIVIYGAWRFGCPYAEEWKARRDVAQLERRARALRAEHSRLQQQARLLATPEGMKIEGRRLGLLKPGERSLRFMTRPEGNRSARSAAPQSPTRPSRDSAAPPQREPAPSGALDHLRAWGQALFGRPGKADAVPRGDPEGPPSRSP
jgi:cell division protein FtsB